ncbi:ABC transporter substrate-binding protein [Actinomyces urogenitalis]|uniref:ABC transporter substrate-binding protein n=1 Tax=Actinomyces urogenitalis TaxID=103621 RepID=UPI001898A432|nr:extracellular solute-binding protein [Actinomyces urogenitalis]MDK8237161.1 extracellular solute-binding protein [Actinomyces urogenitalis]WOO95801.1 extracellular solute-binding protein [Actinomyces urogenitalis]
MLSRLTGLRPLAVVATLALASASLVACSSASQQVGGVTASPASCAQLQEAYGSFPAGTTVRVATQAGNTEAASLDASLEHFSQCTGLSVVQVESDDVAASLKSDSAQADLAVLPEAGVLPELVDEGLVQPVPETVGANVELGWDRMWSEAGTFDGTLYAAPLTASLDSLVWYSPTAFSRLGYQVPQTWPELVALTSQVAQDHPDGSVTPWCLGLASPDAGEEWLAEAVLQLSGPVAYDQWATGEDSLDSVDADTALGELGSLLHTDGHVPGGRQEAESATMQDAAAQLREGQCLMLHAPSAVEALFPAGSMSDAGASSQPEETAGAAGAGDVLSAFLTPSGGQDEETAYLVGASMLVSVSGSEAGEAVMAYLTSAQWAQAYAALGTGGTAHHGVEAAQAGSPVAQQVSQILQSRQSVLRLEVADVATPERVTALREALTAWASGQADGATVLSRAEESSAQ